MKRFLQRNQSPIAALGITVALALWLLSGTGATGSARDPSLEAPRVHRPAVTRVRVKTMESQRVIREVIIYGKTEAARSVTLVLTPSLLVLGERLKFGRRNTAQAQLPEATSTL